MGMFLAVVELTHVVDQAECELSRQMRLIKRACSSWVDWETIDLGDDTEKVFHNRGFYFTGGDAPRMFGPLRRNSGTESKRVGKSTPNFGTHFLGRKYRVAAALPLCRVLRILTISKLKIKDSQDSKSY